MHLTSIKVSPLKTKKYRATFSDGSHTDFGFFGAQDYTQHHDKERRARYLLRHKKDLQTHDPKRAGYLSYYILWGSSTDINANIRAYRNMFNL